LNAALIDELTQAVQAFETDAGIACLVITGSEKAFAAGADIKEMADKTYMDAFIGNFAANWDALAPPRQPTVAAGSGTAARRRVRMGWRAGGSGPWGRWRDLGWAAGASLR